MKTSTKNIQKFDKSKAVGFYKCTPLSDLNDYFKGQEPGRSIYKDDAAAYVKLWGVSKNEKGHKVGNIRCVVFNSSDVREFMDIEIDDIFRDYRVDVIVDNIEIAKLVLIGL